jgi:hypothetical protein
MIFLKLHVVVKGLSEQTVKEVQQHLLEIWPNFYFSHSREQHSLRDCLEFYATTSCSKEEAQKLYEVLNNDWDGEPDDCIAYGFNTKMFDPNVYYLSMEY